MSISVVDPRGDLITMFKMDGAPWRTPAVSRGKAVASASFERASGELTDNAQSPIFRAFMAMEGGHMIPGQGALPIFKNGEIVGAVGGSGGTSKRTRTAAGRASMPVVSPRNRSRLSFGQVTPKTARRLPAAFYHATG